MGKGLSPAAQGQRRGVLEMLKLPPYPIVSMETKGEVDVLTAVSFYSFISFTFGAAGGFAASAAGMETLSAGLGSVFGFFGLMVFIVSTIGVMIETSGTKESIQEILKRDADAAAEGDDEISLRQSLNQGMGRVYVENLSPRQTRWIQRQWKRTFATAVREKEKRDHNKMLAESADDPLDSMVDREKIRKIKYLTKEMKRVHQGKALTDAEQFDKQMKEIETAR